MDWRNKPIGTVLSNEIIKETIYDDGIMYIFEEKSVCSTPLRERDILVEKIFVFKEKNSN